MPKSESVVLDDLVLYAIYKILGKNSTSQSLKKTQTVAHETLVVECFKLFPQHFSLAGYPQYPDSARVNKCWHRCRTDRGWISGNVKKGFSITPLGMLQIERIKDKLGQHRETVARTSTTDRETLLNYLKSHYLFQRYLSDKKNFGVSEPELRSLLMCTMETPPTTLKMAFNQMEGLAKIAGDKLLLSFINACRGKLKEIVRE
jgi:hypothetical protein